MKSIELEQKLKNIINTHSNIHHFSTWKEYKKNKKQRKRYLRVLRQEIETEKKHEKIVEHITDTLQSVEL